MNEENKDGEIIMEGDAPKPNPSEVEEIEMKGDAPNPEGKVTEEGIEVEEIETIEAAAAPIEVEEIPTTEIKAPEEAKA